MCVDLVPFILTHKIIPTKAPGTESLKQQREQALERRKKILSQMVSKNLQCGHKDKKYYAKGKCFSCYQHTYYKFTRRIRKQK